MSMMSELSTPADEIFQKFISRVEETLTQDDKRNLLQICEGQEVTEATSFREIIHLTEGKKRPNMEMLKEMFFKIGRKDLVKLAIEYVSSTKQTVTESDTRDDDAVSVTVRYEYASFAQCRERVYELVKKLSDWIFIPMDTIKVTRIEALSAGGVICVFQIHKLYADILQEHLQDNDTNSGLNYLGVSDIHIYNQTYKIKDKMVPAEKLQEYQKVMGLLRQQNEEYMQRLEELHNDMGTTMDIVAELGDPKTHLKNLENLHRHSGLSTTLWKILGRLSGDQLPMKYTPDFSQEEIRQKCLYSKARMQRLYPHISEPKSHDNA